MTLPKIILTGDRPTGSLHLGHYIGSLKSRLDFQHTSEQYIMIADIQALTHNFHNPTDLLDNIERVMEDYLAIGLDPTKNTFFVQSSIASLHEIGTYYMNLVTVARLHRNPTVKQEMLDKGYDEAVVPAGFFCHPVSQAADITAFQADIVPAGADQKPMIEQTNEIVRKFCTLYKTNCIKEVEFTTSHTPRLMGIDGHSKASKSMNNAIFLCDDSKTVREKVFSMYTDPGHLKVSDIGRVEGNMVFHYLDAFYDDLDHLNQLKDNYTRGGLGDVELKNLLFQVIEKILEPMRSARSQISRSLMKDILAQGNKKANSKASETLVEIRKAVGIYS